MKGKKPQVWMAMVEKGALERVVACESRSTGGWMASEMKSGSASRSGPVLKL